MRVSKQQAGHAQDTVHRRTQFMTHAGHEVALGAAQDLQLLVALFELMRARLDRLLQLAAVTQFAFPPQALQAPQVTERQQAQRQIHQACRHSLPGSGRHMHRNGQPSLAPDAVGIGGAHLEDVVARVQIGICGPMQGTCVDPAAVETLQLIRVMIVRRRGEIERGKIQGDELVVVGQRQRPGRPRQTPAVQWFD